MSNRGEFLLRNRTEDLKAMVKTVPRDEDGPMRRHRGANLAKNGMVKVTATEEYHAGTCIPAL